MVFMSWSVRPASDDCLSADRPSGPRYVRSPNGNEVATLSPGSPDPNLLNPRVSMDNRQCFEKRLEQLGFWLEAFQSRDPFVRERGTGQLEAGSVHMLATRSGKAADAHESLVSLREVPHAGRRLGTERIGEGHADDERIIALRVGFTE